ncbi:hypothetical protein SAVIM338S_04766 [Streptomyces avidinii]
MGLSAWVRHHLQFLHGRERDLLALVRSSDTSGFARAACRVPDVGSDVDSDAYHPSDGESPDADALSRCSRCAVRLECLALALRAEDPEVRSGWYGGFGPEDRDTIATLLLPAGGGRAAGSDDGQAPSERVVTAKRLVNEGWRINDVAELFSCSRRTVQRYLHLVG